MTKTARACPDSPQTAQPSRSSASKTTLELSETTQLRRHGHDPRAEPPLHRLPLLLPGLRLLRWPPQQDDLLRRQRHGRHGLRPVRRVRPVRGVGRPRLPGRHGEGRRGSLRGLDVRHGRILEAKARRGSGVWEWNSVDNEVIKIKECNIYNDGRVIVHGTEGFFNHFRGN